jgi:putative ABC transport system substrate-binding protein
MSRVIQVLVLLVSLTSMSVSNVRADSTDKTKRVGYLVWSSHEARGHLERALLDGMRDAGYVEGRNLIVDRRYVDRANFDELRAAATELANLKPDAIISTCSPSTTAAKEATSKTGTPVIMAFVSDPVAQGLIMSYRHPGGNITGLSSQAEDTLPKMLQYLAEVIPPRTRVAILYNASNSAHSRLWQLVQQAAIARGIELVRVDISRTSDLTAAFESIGRERAGALLVLPDDNMTYNARVELNELLKRRRLPAIFGAREFVDVGGLMSYGPSLTSSYRNVAVYVDKVLRGASPADTPVEQPKQFEFVVNTAAAKALGITFPQALIVSADAIVNEVPASATSRPVDAAGKREDKSDGM